MINLPENGYIHAVRELRKVTFNSLFARSVVEKHVDGKVFVDNIQNPRVFYVLHPYGMALLYGDVSSTFFKSELKEFLIKNETRSVGRWIQVFPLDIGEIIDELIINMDDSENTTLIKLERINFKFNLERYRTFRRELELEKYFFCEIDKSIFNDFNGGVVPKKFWNNAKEFISKGSGFSLIVDDHPVSIAFSSFVHEDMLELGMETKPNYRKKGYASIVCARLINYCIENGLEPIWACSSTNYASYELAKKLGFEPVQHLPYYELIK